VKQQIEAIPCDQARKVGTTAGWTEYLTKHPSGLCVAEAKYGAIHAETCPAGFAFIEGGTFTMGSENDSEASSDEKPAHRVTVSGFCLARTEVTQADWESVMGSNPSSFKGANRPVEEVSWNDAIEYCNKRSQKEGLRPVYGSDGSVDRQANGYRLPTEAEWEYAARGGSTAPRYGDLDSIAWYSGNSGPQTHDVGQKRPNGYGLYDMLGNVWEWTQDWYGGYSAGSQTDPEGPASGSARVFRGGSWDGGASRARAGSRSLDDPSNRSYYLGFRPLRSLP
jgi:formylglycine-generating enzyme required for sulfatase activity